MRRRTSNSKRPIDWRLFRGGHLGQLPAPNNAVWTLDGTSPRELWVAAASAVLVYRDGRWEHTPLDAVLPHFYIAAFSRAHGYLWAGGPQLFRLTHNRWSVAAADVIRNITCMTVDAAGRLWVGTLFGALWRSSDGHHWEQVMYPGAGGAAWISALWGDADGAVWLAEAGRRPASRPLLRWGAGTWKQLPLPERSRGFLQISVITTDQCGAVWVGTEGRGVWRWAEGKWTHFSAAGFNGLGLGLPGNNIRGLCADRYNHIWAATHNGIGWYDGVEWRMVLGAPNAVDVKAPVQIWTPDTWSPSAMSLSADGRLWIGTTDGQIGWLVVEQRALAWERLAEQYYQPGPIRVEGLINEDERSGQA